MSDPRNTLQHDKYQAVRVVVVRDGRRVVVVHPPHGHGDRWAGSYGRQATT
jgi:hypothetical protein